MGFARRTSPGFRPGIQNEKTAETTNPRGADNKESKQWEACQKRMASLQTGKRTTSRDIKYLHLPPLGRERGIFTFRRKRKGCAKVDEERTKISHQRG